MQIFRRQIFRRLARVLAVLVLLGNTAVVLASVDTLLNDVGQVVPCHMQSKDSHKAAGGCCTDKCDGMQHCNTCTISAPSVMFVSASHFNFYTLHPKYFLPRVANIPDGISSGLLYRPPIFSA